jgi:hypothetical protein
MLKVYLNYPESHITRHRDPNCQRIHVQNKLHQRNCRIGITNISAELEKFKEKQYRFQSTSAFNDMWLEIDFQDEAFEDAILGYIHKILGQHYKRFLDSHPTTHC